MAAKNTTAALAPGHMYDNIKTPKQLVTTVMAHGLSTDINDICRAQDIFGQAPISDLVELANDDNQAANKRGCSVGAMSTFYMILYSIWNWEQATQFYNEHSNPSYKHLREQLKDYQEGAKVSAQRIDGLERQKELWKADEQTMHTRILELEQRAGKAETQLAAAEQTILELKAKLYDLMMGGDK